MFFTHVPPPPEVCPILYREEHGYAQGQTGQQMHRVIAEAVRQWNERNELKTEIGDYNSVPFKSVGRMKVKYTGIRPLKPMSFELDDE